MLGVRAPLCEEAEGSLPGLVDVIGPRGDGLEEEKSFWTFHATIDEIQSNSSDMLTEY